MWKIKIDSHVSQKSYTQEKAIEIIEHLLEIQYGTTFEMFKVEENENQCYN